MFHIKTFRFTVNNVQLRGLEIILTSDLMTNNDFDESHNTGHHKIYTSIALTYWLRVIFSLYDVIIVKTYNTR